MAWALQTAIQQVTNDQRVIKAMLLGAMLEGGSLSGPWPRGDNGQSAGPFQINSPGNGGVDLGNAEQIPWAVAFMAPRYIAAVNQVPADLWRTNARQAAAQAVYIAERPAKMYSPQNVGNAWAMLHNGNGSAGLDTPLANGSNPTKQQIIDAINNGQNPIDILPGVSIPAPNVPNPLAPVGGAVAFLSDQRNWVAILFVVAGAGLIVGGLFSVANHDGAATTAAMATV